MYDPTDDDEDEVTEAELRERYSLKNAKLQQWLTKDRTVAQVRMADKDGLCDMKIYLLLRAKVHQMEIELGIHAEHIEEH